jgi:hypothetical protein
MKLAGAVAAGAGAAGAAFWWAVCSIASRAHLVARFHVAVR